MVKRYKKRPTKPELIEAMQFTEDCDAGALVDWIKGSHKSTITAADTDGKVTAIYFFNGLTYEHVGIGDYLVKYPDGVLYGLKEYEFMREFEEEVECCTDDWIFISDQLPPPVDKYYTVLDKYGNTEEYVLFGNSGCFGEPYSFFNGNVIKPENIVAYKEERFQKKKSLKRSTNKEGSDENKY